MRISILAVLLILFGIAAFALGRTTASDRGPDVPTDSDWKDVTLRVGDQLHVPSIALFCRIDLELERIPRMACHREGQQARYQVRFGRDWTEVGRLGDPGNVRTFPER
jgi:hypothetical protein